MAKISSEEMAALQEQAGTNKGDGVTALVKQVGEGLMKLSQIMGESQAVTDKDREQMGMIMQMYSDLVEKNLGNTGPGEEVQEEEMPGDMGAVPMQAGRNGVPMGPQSRM